MLRQTPHGVFYLPANDEFIGASMGSGRHWEAHILHRMLESLPADGVCVDAGSFVGTHTIPLARRARTVMAFEPQHRVFQLLCSNAAINGITQRVATVKNADQIIVLDQGQVVGKGAHHELMDTCETYREIAFSQLSQEELS